MKLVALIAMFIAGFAVVGCATPTTDTPTNEVDVVVDGEDMGDADVIVVDNNDLDEDNDTDDNMDDDADDVDGDDVDGDDDDNTASGAEANDDTVEVQVEVN